jgi:16S rRNA (uracil1498-N3)-methyltransferase
MKLHRFFVHDTELAQSFWLNNNALYHQWTRVLRYEVGREVELFNDKQEDRLYRIIKIGDNAVQLELVTEFEPKVPKVNLYLCFALLKKDKNDWVLQKGTELGVRHFVPLLTDRTEKTGFDVERAEKIVIEAAEQCGRSDIPRIREPIHVTKLIDELEGETDLYVAEQGSPLKSLRQLADENLISENGIAIFVGPEGGWSEAEKQLFKDKNLKHLALSEFTLRAETAAITAAALLQ